MYIERARLRWSYVILIIPKDMKEAGIQREEEALDQRTWSMKTQIGKKIEEIYYA